MMPVAEITASAPSALALRHDLWIEMERMEMALDDLGEDAVAKRQQMERRRTQLRQAMQRLPE